MICLKVTDIKKFMAKLLLQETFDSFLLEEAGVLTFAMVRIQGRRNEQWYDSDREELTEYISWGEIRPFVFQYIRGDRTPAVMKISLKAGEGQAGWMLGDMGVIQEYQQHRPALLLHIRYEGRELALVTGTAFSEFVMDRGLERAWDEAVMKWLQGQSIPYEES